MHLDRNDNIVGTLKEFAAVYGIEIDYQKNGNEYRCSLVNWSIVGKDEVPAFGIGDSQGAAQEDLRRRISGQKIFRSYNDYYRHQIDVWTLKASESCLRRLSAHVDRDVVVSVSDIVDLLEESTLQQDRVESFANYILRKLA